MGHKGCQKAWEEFSCATSPVTINNPCPQQSSDIRCCADSAVAAPGVSPLQQEDQYQLPIAAPDSATKAHTGRGLHPVTPGAESPLSTSSLRGRTAVAAQARRPDFPLFKLDSTFPFKLDSALCKKTSLAASFRASLYVARVGAALIRAPLKARVPRRSTLNRLSLHDNVTDQERSRAYN